MVEQRDRECDAFHEAVQVCSEEMTEHARKVLYLEQCYRAVCAGEMLSWQIRLDLCKAFLVTGPCSSVSAQVCLRARRLCCCSEQMGTGTEAFKQ